VRSLDRTRAILALLQEPSLNELHLALSAALAEVGLDLVHGFDVDTYNASAPPEDCLPTFGLPGRSGLLLANSRALWPPFRRAYCEDIALRAAEHPLEQYLESRVARSLEVLSGRRYALVWAHTTSPRAFPIQRLAEKVGFATLSPSHLSIHAEHGPWLALRAVLVLDVARQDPPEAKAPLNLCQQCSRPCLVALERALHVTGKVLDAHSIARASRAWIEVRDACPVGQDSRYSEPQLQYHYTKAAEHLR
jgi:methylmalonic aciduria homocystinuria type C protein